MRARTIGNLRGRASWRTWVALLCVPALLMGVLVLAFHDPGSQLDKVNAAVVNDDTPVTVDGQVRPMGRQLAKELVNASGDDYNWVLTTADDASQGLADGDYSVAVEIPSDFSAKATSVAGNDAGAVTQASVTITTAADSPLLDAQVGTTLADAAERSLGQQITQTYVDTVLTSMGTLHDGLSTAAEPTNCPLARRAPMTAPPDSPTAPARWRTAWTPWRPASRGSPTASASCRPRPPTCRTRPGSSPTAPPSWPPAPTRCPTARRTS